MNVQGPPAKNLLVPNVERWPLDPAKPVIELEDVTMTFGSTRVLDGLSLQIPTGRTTVILGRGGSGKSVLLKLMMGLLRPHHGRVLLFGRDLATVSEVEMIELRKRMAMVFQNYALFDGLSVTDNIEFALHDGSSLGDAEIAKVSGGLIHLLDLDGSERQLPGELSGGMRKRVGLARALVANPEVVLYDEPTTGLDPMMVKRVDEMIALAKDTYGITSVVISHDLTSTRRIADSIRFLDQGKIVLAGPFESLATSHLECVRTFVDAMTSAPTAMPVSTKPARDLSVPVVELVDVTKTFGTKHVLRGVNLQILPRQTTVLIGASGSGKSVIVKHIMGLLHPTSGRVVVLGKDLATVSDRELDSLRAHFGLVFQQGALLDWLSVRDNVSFPLTERRASSSVEVNRRVDEVLEMLNLTGLRNAMPGDLSLAQKKRVGLGRAVVTKPEILIYDEPTTGQDPMRTRDIDDLIKQMQAQFDVASIIVSHDMHSTFQIADRIAVLHDGAIVAFGPPAEIRASTDEYVQRFIRAAD